MLSGDRRSLGGRQARCPPMCGTCPGPTHTIAFTCIKEPSAGPGASNVLAALSVGAALRPRQHCPRFSNKYTADLKGDAVLEERHVGLQLGRVDLAHTVGGRRIGGPLHQGRTLLGAHSRVLRQQVCHAGPSQAQREHGPCTGHPSSLHQQLSIHGQWRGAPFHGRWDTHAPAFALLRLGIALCRSDSGSQHNRCPGT